MYPFLISEATTPGNATADQIWDLESIRKAEKGQIESGRHTVMVLWKNMTKEEGWSQMAFDKVEDRDVAFDQLYKEMLAVATNVRVESFPA